MNNNQILYELNNFHRQTITKTLSFWGRMSRGRAQPNDVHKYEWPKINKDN